MGREGPYPHLTAFSFLGLKDAVNELTTKKQSRSVHFECV